jgi:hypothetical protein
VAAAHDLGFHLLQFRRQPFPVGFPPYPEPPGRGGLADVREPQEPERLRFPLAPRCPSPGGEPPEFNQPGLVRVQLQAELREPSAQVCQEPLGIVLVLEAGDEVVGLCRSLDYAGVE